MKTTKWEEKLRTMLVDAGLKPIHFKMNNSGVRIEAFIQSLLDSQRKEIVEIIKQQPIYKNLNQEAQDDLLGTLEQLDKGEIE